jgi:hypothetical protein
MSLPLLAAVLNGQDVAIVLLAASLAIEAARRGWVWTAGLLLSICSIKFHLIALALVVLLVQRRWRFLVGFLSGGMGLLATSFVAAGPDWPWRYLLALRKPEMHPCPESMPTFRSLVYALTGRDAPLLIVLLSLVVLAAVVYISRHAGFELAFACGLLGGVLTAYHAYMPDCLMLLLPFVLILKHSASRALRAGMAVLLMPPLYLCLAMGYPWSAIVPLAILAVLLMAGSTLARSAQTARVPV